MLEGFKGEPEEDDGVEEAVQTMGPEDLQRMEGSRRGLGVSGGRRFREEGESEKERNHEKRVWGAPAFPATPDLGSLCQLSARLSGGFVGASSLNGNPADRHVVYPLCLLGGRVRLLSVCTSGERRADNVSVCKF